MHDRSRYSSIAAIGLLSLGALFPSQSGSAQEIACDKHLEELGGGPHGYGRRGDRCEGLYTREVVGGTPLIIASLTESFEDYNLTSGADLVVEWAGPAGHRMRLRAQGVRHDLFYQMDAVRPATPQSYRWPTDLLAAQHIPRQNIGVVGWTTYRVAGEDRDLYVPLRIRQHHPASSTGEYELVLFPAAELAEIYVTIATVGADGNPEKFLRQGKGLRYGPYGAETPVIVTLHELKRPGVYYLEIGADLAAGGTTTLPPCWVYRGR